MNFGERIYELRSRQGLSQGELADRLGVSRQAVSKWENNSAVPDLDKLLKMSEIFSVSLDELVKGEGFKEITRAREAETPVEVKPQTEEKASAVQTEGRLPVRKIFALIFFGLTLLTVVLSFAVADIDILTLCIPFVCLGLICWFSKNHVGLNCLWFVYIFFQFYSVFMMGGLNFSIYSLRFMFQDIRYLFIGLGAVALLIFIVVFTVMRVKDRPIKKPQRAKAGLITLWAVSVLYFIFSQTVGPFLVDSFVISMQRNELLNTAMTALSFSDNLVPVILFTAAISFTVRYVKSKRT